MLTPEQIEAAKIEAQNSLYKDLHEAEVKKQVEKLKARKLHWFSKRLVFQWPFRFEEWIKTSGCCKS